MRIHDKSHRHPIRGALILAGTALLSTVSGCDNPACVFSTSGCNGSTGAIGDHPASVPDDAEWIELAAPTILDTFPPSETPVDVHTPVVIVFSESMRPVNEGETPPAGLASAFELKTETGGTVDFGSGTLIGNGKVLVLLPQAALLAASTYRIVMTDSAVLTDRTGQSLAHTSLIGTFRTVVSPAAVPKVVMTWPGSDATNQGGTTEIDVVFDRAIDPATMDTDSFAVTVGGNPPAFDPQPQPLSVDTSTTDTRAFLWRSLDAEGLPASLGELAHVEVLLSSTGHEILDEGGDALAETTFAFDTAPFSAPLSAAITSDPTDAIGINEISGASDLAVQVQLSGAESGDFVVLTMFGAPPDVTPATPLIALRREVALTAPFDSFTWTAAEIDLLRSAAPVGGRFADGPVTFAFQLRRGSTQSPIRLLDVDLTSDGVQSPVLDTTAPILLGLGVSGTTQTSYRSDMRDVVLVGRASERLLRAEVDTPLGTNELVPGRAPPVVGSDEGGLFVAAPVRLGVLQAAEEQLDYTLTIYDQALNATTVRSDGADPTDGFRQIGASGPGTALPGGSVIVEVFDAATLAPVRDANVHVHQVLNGVLRPVTLTPVPTDPAGIAPVPAASTGTTVVSVDKAGYDLFTFEGVPTSRLSVPLTPEGLANGRAIGSVGPIDAATATSLNLYTDKSVADSRRLETGPILLPVSACAIGPDPPSYECPFGPIPIRPDRIGAQTAITVLVPGKIFEFSALTFLKTAAIALPRSPALPGQASNADIPIPFLLDQGNLDPEERPIDVPEHVLSTTAWPALPSNPEITVEATSPGIPGTVTVGRGVAYNDTNPPADAWHVRAAYPGSADGIQDFPGDERGSLVTQGTIDADLLLQVQVEDLLGNSGGARPRFSATTLFLSPPAPPALPASPITPNGTQGFNLSFPDVLPDAVSLPGRGLYRVSLTDSTFRSWTVFLPDPPDALGPDVILHLPKLGGVFPLESGDVDARISAWSWPTLDLSEFLWSDIDREHDLWVHSAVQTFTLP